MRESNHTFSAETLDSELLRTFLAIAGAGSFTKGAERIFRSQSAASLQIKKLEGVLGQPVFERHGRGVVLTPLGEKLRPVAQRVVGLLDSSLAEMRSDPLEGAIRIGIPDGYGEATLSRVIAEFARAHPRVELVVQCAFSADFPNALERGDLDIAVFETETAQPGTILLREEKTFWVASRHHLAYEQDPLPLALFDRACWWRERALRALQDARRTYRVVYTSESVAGVAAAIEAGVAVGLLGDSSLKDDFIILGEPQGFPVMPKSMLVLDRRSEVDSPVAQAMVTAIKRAFRNPART